jgi:hypothetical protein
MPPSLEPGDLIAVEIRLLDRTEAGYPVEMTLTNTQQVFRGRLGANVLPWGATGDARTDGQRLFTSLFTSADLIKGWGVAQGRSKQMRLRLRIDPLELHALPWELLCDEIDLLAADADTPFSRYLAVSREWGTAIAVRPIRVLAVISNPIDLEEKYGLPQADVDLETQALKAAIGPAAQLDFLAAPITLDRLETELRKGYHILHFIGHGAFNARTKQAALYMQDAAGNAQRVLDADFAGMLNRLQAPPRLVVLAACQSAQQSTSAAFTGLGPQLVQIGLPAVIAMQENVTVVTARQFAATFYQRLLEHGTVDLAMNEARGTLITSGRFDAAVPVLFMRLPDGRLWDVAASKKERTTMTEETKSTKKTDSAAKQDVHVERDMIGRDRVVQTGSNQGKHVNQTGGGVFIDNSGNGGVNIGGNANISGKVTGRDDISNERNDVVYGNKTVTTGGSKYVGGDDSSVTGWSAKDVENFFAKVTQKIDAKPELAPTDKEDLKAEVQDLQTEVAKGEEANESFLERRLRNIKRMAPDILDTIATTLASPQAGLASVIRKVMQKAQADAKA